MRNIPLSLDANALYDKIVTRHRGGYCFELNGLFTWLLRSLGFPVTEYMSRFLRDAEGTDEIPMRRHRVLRVACGGAEYLCDVGVGSVAPRKPLPLSTGTVSEQGSERYVLERHVFFGYVLFEWHNNEWRKLYSFTEEEQLDIDYIMPSFYCEQHPDSDFRKMDMVHIFTENGRKSVAGREIRIFKPGGTEVLSPATEEAYHELLTLHFGIKL
jgi:N-hydroxyarylamine O-acetyltransferase